MLTFERTSKSESEALAPLHKSDAIAIYNALSERQQALYGNIHMFIKEHGVPPTVRELAAHTGIGNGTAHLYLQRLERVGLIVRVPRQSRCIRLVPVCEEEGEEEKSA